MENQCVAMRLKINKHMAGSENDVIVCVKGDIYQNIDPYIY